MLCYCSCSAKKESKAIAYLPSLLLAKLWDLTILLILGRLSVSLLDRFVVTLSLICLFTLLVTARAVLMSFSTSKMSRLSSLQARLIRRCKYSVS